MSHAATMGTDDVLQVGDRVQIGGGYSFDPAWLAGEEYTYGVVTDFLPGQNETPDAVVKLDKSIYYQHVTGDFLVLQLRYVGAWKETGVVHVELCDFVPEPMPWQNRRKGKWAESHATYTQLAA